MKIKLLYPKGYRKNMTHINCKKCNHYGLILFALKPNSNQTYFRCLKCKNEIEMYKKN